MLIRSKPPHSALLLRAPLIKDPLNSPAVSLDLLASDLRVMVKGLKEVTGELVKNKSNEHLKTFCIEAEPRVTKLQDDFVTSKVNEK